MQSARKPTYASPISKTQIIWKIKTTGHPEDYKPYWNVLQKVTRIHNVMG